jgi:hypothetical protein
MIGGVADIAGRIDRFEHGQQIEIEILEVDAGHRAPRSGRMRPATIYAYQYT